ncbi:MAG: phosphoribosyltransferase [Cardiobacteriaceae bacterium]|nr:phosphoribosyltransferase [Cardiobacteriaceae bacterium]
MPSERAPWGNFPPVITNGFIDSLSDLPGYDAAKAGDADAALQLVLTLIKPETVEAVRRNFKPDLHTLIVPVHAEEAAGRNKIPVAIAKVLAADLGLQTDESIVQVNRVRRTGSNANHRLAFPPTFDGDVQKGKNYIIVDDTLTQGGTLAALRGHIENRGGHVLGMMVMSAKNYSLQIAPTSEILHNIHQKHGDAMNEYFLQEFGYGIEQLTHSEAAHALAAANVDTFRDRIAQARFAGGSGLDGSSIGTTQSTEKSELTPVLTALLAENPKAILKTEKPTVPCRGCVVLATENFIIQQVADGSRYFQVHRKDALGRVPDVGERVNISYSSKEPLARVREFTQRQKCRQ